MSRKLLFALLIWTGFTACSEEWVWPMEEPELVNLLVDLHIAEAAANNLHGTQKDSIIQLYYHQVYQIHGVDSASFDRIYNQLEAQPTLFEHVYEEVVEEIGRREAERTNLNAPRPRESRPGTKDSIPATE